MEIRVEVDERVERLVRLTNVVREDGDSRPLNFEVLRTVEKGTEHEWHKIAGPVAQQVPEQVLDKSEKAKGTSKSKEQKKTARCSGCTRKIVFGLWMTCSSLMTTPCVLLVTRSGIVINLRSTVGVKAARPPCRWKRARCSVSCRMSTLLVVKGG